MLDLLVDHFDGSLATEENARVIDNRLARELEQMMSSDHLLNTPARRLLFRHRDEIGESAPSARRLRRLFEWPETAVAGQQSKTGLEVGFLSIRSVLGVLPEV